MLSRIINSKKTILGAIPILANLVASFFGVDLEGQMMLLVDSIFGLLVVGQFALDYKHGSPSDGSGEAGS